MAALRVVLDTNILVSKLLFSPGSAWLVQAWQNQTLLTLQDAFPIPIITLDQLQALLPTAQN